MPTTEPGWITSLRDSLVRLDKFMVGLSLLLLLLIVIGQVLLRNLFDSGVPHADILSRYLVLYITFFGAGLAVERHAHIRIDVLAVMIEPDRLVALRRPLYLISAVVCAVLTWAAMRFWYDDWQYVPEHERWSSILALVTPFGFALLCLHFLLAALFPVLAEEPPP